LAGVSLAEDDIQSLDFEMCHLLDDSGARLWLISKTEFVQKWSVSQISLLFRVPNVVAVDKNILLLNNCKINISLLNVEYYSVELFFVCSLITCQIIHPNGGFTFVWFSIKTLVFPVIAAELLWFIWRVSHLDRKPNILEQ
jgi:hypothetical protein